MSPSLAGALRRRWYLVAVGLLASVVLAWQLAQVKGVYFAEVYVIFLPPNSTAHPNSVAAANNASLVSMAGIVGRAVSAEEASQPVSDRVTIIGEGLKSGDVVRQPNSGGQWTVHYTRPELDVQVAGSDASAVRARLAELLTAIDSETRTRQVALGTAPRNLVTTRLSPPTPGVYVYSGSKTRAAAASFGLGVVLTLALAVAVDGWLSRRRGGLLPVG